MKLTDHPADCACSACEDADDLDQQTEPAEPDYDPGPSLTDQYQAAWQSKFGPGGTHRRN